MFKKEFTQGKLKLEFFQFAPASHALNLAADEVRDSRLAKGLLATFCICLFAVIFGIVGASVLTRAVGDGSWSIVFFVVASLSLAMYGVFSVCVKRDEHLRSQIMAGKHRDYFVVPVNFSYKLFPAYALRSSNAGQLLRICSFLAGSRIEELDALSAKKPDYSALDAKERRDAKLEMIKGAEELFNKHFTDSEQVHFDVLRTGVIREFEHTVATIKTHVNDLQAQIDNVSEVVE